MGAVLAACILVSLGLNTAAHGLKRIAPEVPGEILLISEANQIWAVEVLGRQFDFNVRTAQDFIIRGKDSFLLTVENIQKEILPQIFSRLKP
ncbi:MAG: hypothetical protein PHT78_14550 [Desulfitobacteriaceae bacterium]|nr:hypothetical protein [Desulfitobacteriaceae bacterium]